MDPVHDLSFGDLNGDLLPDVFFVDERTHTPCVLIRDGHGAFEKEKGVLLDQEGEQVLYIENIFGSSWSDYNKDEYEDLVLGTDVGIQIYQNIPYDESGVRALKLIHELFDTSSSQNGCTGRPSWLDVNLDGVLDVIVVCDDINTVPLSYTNVRVTYPFMLYMQTQEGRFYDSKKDNAWTNPWSNENRWEVTNFFIEDLLRQGAESRLPPKGMELVFAETTFLYDKPVQEVSQIIGEQKVGISQFNMILVGNYVDKLGEDFNFNLQSNLPFFIRVCPCSKGLQPSLWHVLKFWSRCVQPEIKWNKNELIDLGLSNKEWEMGEWVITDAYISDVNNDLQQDIILTGKFPTSKKDSSIISLILLSPVPVLTGGKLIWTPKFLVAPHTPLNSWKDKNEPFLWDTQKSVVSVADFDNDMDLDLVFFSQYDAGVGRGLFYENVGNSFVLQPVELVENLLFSGYPFVSVIDVNKDGYLDIWRSYGSEVPGLLLNNGIKKSKNHWVEIDYFGQNNFGTHLSGARVFIQSGGVDQLRHINSGSHSFSSNSKTLHFGLGNNTDVTFIRAYVGPPRMVGVSTYKNMPADRNLILTGFGEGEFSNRMIDIIKKSDPYVDPVCNLQGGYERLSPTFIIIGVWKSGTSALFWYLSQNPHVLTPTQKELQFFKRRFSAGLGYYESQFPCGKPNYHMSLEGSPGYFVMLDVPQRIYTELPDTQKFVLCVRNPVERTYSHFRMIVRNRGISVVARYYNQVMAKKENAVEENIELVQLFDLFVKHEIENITKCLESHPEILDDEVAKTCLSDIGLGVTIPSLYYYFLSYWLKFFDKSSFYFVNFSDILDPVENPLILKQVGEFVGLPDFNYNVEISSLRVDSTSMLEGTRQLLVNFFIQPNMKFYDTIGKTFPW